MKIASVGLALALCLTGELAAQQTLRMSGVIRDPAGNPIADVGVLVLPGDRVARSDAQGRFGFDGLPAAPYYISLRRLGYLPVNQRVEVGRDTLLQFTMPRRPQLLDTIVVTDQCSRVNFSGFLCRRQKGNGIFLTEADILAKNPKFLADIFLDMKDFHIEAVNTPYGPNRIVNTTQSRCIVELFDGRPPITRDFQLDASTQMAGASGRELVSGNQHGPQELLGVEIYPPGYDTPEEYMGRAAKAPARRAMSGSGFEPKARRVKPAEDRCVLVNYWTSRSLPRQKRKG